MKLNKILALIFLSLVARINYAEGGLPTHLDLTSTKTLDGMFEGQSFFISATRLEQSPHDTPASTTTITSETIADLQLTTIEDVMRYVSGMLSARVTGLTTKVSYHGTNITTPRRMQVLINGISVFRPAYAEINWGAFPISVKDIDRIEVVRSPSGATYGSNSMLAVVSITTKKSYSSDFFGASYTTGSRNFGEANLHFSDSLSEKVSYRLSFSDYNTDGYDKELDGTPKNDNSRKQSVNLDLDYKPTISTDLNTYISYSKTENQLNKKERNQTSYPIEDINTGVYKLDLSKHFSDDHELKFSTYYTTVNMDASWNSCHPAILFSEPLSQLYLQNPNYVNEMLLGKIPTGGTASDDALRDMVLGQLAVYGPSAYEPVCGSTGEQSRENRYSAEMTDTLIFSDNLRLVAGASYDKYTIDSPTFLHGKESSEAFRLFGNIELKGTKHTINAGLMAEYEPKYLSEPLYSPRLGYNYKISSNSTIRFILSRSQRTPDILENDLDWSYSKLSGEANPVTGNIIEEFYLRARSDNHIKQEEIISREVSYYYENSYLFEQGKLTLSSDLKFFHNSLDNLVSEKLQYFDYNPTNEGNLDLEGFEYQADLALKSLFFKDYVNSLSFHINYMYLDSETNNTYEEGLYARHSGSAYLIAKLKNNYSAFVSYYGNSAMYGESFDGFEIGGGKIISLNKGSFEIKGKAIYWPDKTDSFLSDLTANDSRAYNVNNDSLSYLVSVNFTY